MQAHIIDSQRLVRLTQNPDTLRVLVKPSERLNFSSARRPATPERLSETSPGKCGGRILGLYTANFLMLSGESQRHAGRLPDLQTPHGRSTTQDTKEGYLNSHWQELPQQPVVSSTVV